MRNFKYISILVLVTSFLWLPSVFDSKLWLSLVSIIVGACIVMLAKASTTMPALTFRNMGNRMPFITALILLPLLMLIPLGFQKEMLESFYTWQDILQSKTLTKEFFYLTGLLFAGGLYITIIVIAYQVVSKKVVDKFFTE